jgi:hypothetical protein
MSIVLKSYSTKAVLFVAACCLTISAQEPAWVLKSPATIPAARTMHSIAYDELRRQIVMFGGNGAGSEYERFWLWDGTNWIRPTSAHLPGSRYGAAMAYHAASGEVVLFGGYASGLLSNETWVWNGVDWTQRFPTHSPSPRADVAMAYDAARRQTILFGGFASGAQPNGETWAWDGADWTRLNPSSSPLPRSLHAMTYDSARQQVVLFGGQGASMLGDTWVWDGASWMPKQSTPAPAARMAHALQFDPRLAVSVLHGGSPVTTRDAYSDTWAWDGSTWKQYPNPGQPVFLTAHSMAYDQTRAELILFGGTDGRQTQNQTRAWVVPTAGQTNLRLSPTSLTFEQSPPGPQPAPQSFTITTSGGSASFAVTESTTDGRNWLRVSAAAGTTPANLTVSVDATGLAPGSYYGILTVTAASAINSPQKLFVQLEVRRGAFTFQPPTLSIESYAGSSTPVTRQIQLGTLTPGQVGFTASASQPWVTISPVAGVSPTILNVTIQPANLPAGNNHAQVTLSSTTGQVGPGAFSVDAQIQAVPRLTVKPASVNSTLVRNASPQTIALTATTLAPSLLVRAEVAPGAPWLTIDPHSGTPAPDLTFNLTLNPTGLTPGNYSGIVWFNSTGTVQGPVPVIVTMTVTDQRRMLSQIADGSLWQTTLTLVNLGTTPALFTLRFYANGMPLPLALEGFASRQSVVESVIPPNGTRVIRTTGSDALLSQGWAELESAGDIEGVGIFRQRAEGRPDLEAAVTTTAPASRSLLPFNNLQAYTTSLALVNPSLTTAANLSVSARDQNGLLLSPSSLSLPAGNQAAFASQTLFPATTNQSGVLDVTGSAPFAGLGLRFDPAGPFTSYPLMAIPTQPLQNQVLSQLADGGAGGEWQTTLTLVNLDTQPALYTLRFWAQSGLPLAVPITGQLSPVQSLQNTIPTGGVHTIVTKGEATPLIQGWTELVSTNAIGGLAVFRQRIPGQTGNAAVVTAVPRARNLVLPYDNTEGALTSIALVNVESTRSSTLAIGLYDEAGGLFGSELLQLPPRGQEAFLLIDRLPALRNRRGILRISTPDGEISGLALRFNPTGAFTSIPLFVR